MSFIHANRLPISSLGRKIFGNLEPETITMSVQSFPIKSNDWAPRGRIASHGILHKLALVAAAIYDRTRRPTSLRLWMLSERALRDLGYEASDAEISRLSDAGSIPLGHFGFASLLLRNRRDGALLRFRG